jgi:hypothetical protein
MVDLGSREVGPTVKGRCFVPDETFFCILVEQESSFVLTRTE